MTKTTLCVSTLLAAASALTATATVEPIPFGNMNQWVTRNIKESGLIGGNDKTLYEIGPSATINGNISYTPRGNSPWGTSNVYAKVAGVTKGSNAVYPAVRSGANKCAKLCSQIEEVKVLGLVDMKVMVAGSIFLGSMIEPIKSTSNPYSKMDMGMRYTKRPKALVFDYKVDMPTTNSRIKASGVGDPRTMPGRDAPVVFVMLQSRWEDAAGNIHAKRVATGGRKFTSGSQWVNSYRMPITYGSIVGKPGMNWLGLRSKNSAYYARNSKGKMVPVLEEGYDANATPTHVIVMMSAGDGEPYVGTPGLNLYIDNVGFDI